MSEHLSPLDATFLELEEIDESAHMHIGAILVFEPGPDGIPSLEAVREQVQARLPTLPRYRQRLSEPHTHGLHWPFWADYEQFDVADHVRHAALPSPGGESELREWAADFWSQRLDRHLPLWEVVLLEGLADGRWALCTKTHHCLADGVGAVDAASLLLDATPDGAPPPGPAAPDGAPRRDDPDAPLAAVSRAAASVARTGAAIARHPLETLSRSRSIVELIVRDEVLAAPHTSLGVPIGTRRRYATVSARLDDVKEVKRALGGTVNDVVLTAVAGGLRALLEHRGETPPQGLRAMVPVNLRDAGERLGNHVSSLFVELPVCEPDPLARYRATQEATTAQKSGAQAVGGTALIGLAGLAPPLLLHSVLARSMFASRLFNVTVTNVPGPQQAMYAFGARMLDVLPLVPLAAEHAVGIAVVSYDGRVTFGINADYESVEDVGVLADALGDALIELYGAARAARA